MRKAKTVLNLVFWNKSANKEIKTRSYFLSEKAVIKISE